MRRKKTEIMEWMDATLAGDPELSRAVDARLEEMRREQDEFARRERAKASLRPRVRRHSISEVRRRFSSLIHGKAPFFVTKRGRLVAVVYPLTSRVSLPFEVRRELARERPDDRGHRRPLRRANGNEG